MGKVYLGSDVGSDVGSSGGYSGSVFERALARSALEPFRFRKYLFLPRWLAIPDLFLLQSIGRCDYGNGLEYL